MTQTEESVSPDLFFCGQFSWLMCPALSSFGEAFEAKEVVAIYSLTKLGLLAQSPLEAETRTHLVLFRLVLLSKVLNHTTHMSQELSKVLLSKVLSQELSKLLLLCQILLFKVL